MSSTAKRFFNNNWDEPCFSSLSIKEKLLYKYIWERADIGGICQINTMLMTAYLSAEVDMELIKLVISKINHKKERLRLIDNDKIWIKEYARYQQMHNGGSLSASSPPHKSVVSHLKRAGVFNEAVQSDPELFKNYETLSLNQPLDKGYSYGIGNSAGKGSSLGSGSSSSSTPYKQSLAIAERLSTNESQSLHDNTKEVNSMIKKLEESTSHVDPFNHIDYVLTEMEGYYSKSELTVEALREKLFGKDG